MLVLMVLAGLWHLAGKTSLLCALAGKASYGRVTGRVYINGCLDRLDRYKKVDNRPHRLLRNSDAMKPQAQDLFDSLNHLQDRQTFG